MMSKLLKNSKHIILNHKVNFFPLVYHTVQLLTVIINVLKI